MNLFSKQDVEKLTDEIAGLRGDIKVLTAEKKSISKAVSLGEEVTALKEKLETLKLEEDRLKEKHERERRDVEHMVGLERRRQEFEVEQAKRETKVELREVALEEQRKRFEEQMKFIEDRLATEVKYLKDDIVKALLERLPTWEHRVTERVGASNGNGEE